MQCSHFSELEKTSVNFNHVLTSEPNYVTNVSKMQMKTILPEAKCIKPRQFNRHHQKI